MAKNSQIEQSQISSAANSDVPGDTNTTFELTVDAPVSGNIDASDDQDWYRFDTKAGTTYVFDLEGNTSGAGTLGNPFLRMLDANGNEIASNGDAWWTGTPNSQIGYSAAADGLVYVSAQTEDGGTGSYALRAQEISGDVPGSTATTLELPVAAPVSSKIDFAFDQDWYQFQVKSGATYLFDLEGSYNGAGTWGNPYLRLLDADGNEIASNDDAGSPNSQIGYSAAADGVVFVSAGWPSGGDPGTGTYRLSAQEIVGDVPDNTSTKVPLPVDAPVSGNIDFAFDQDWHRFEAKGGSTYVFDLEGSYNGAGTLGNPYLRLLDSAGNEIANNDDIGWPNQDSQLGYSAPADGVVFVSAGTPWWYDAGTGTYRLSAHEIVGDVPGSTATTAKLSVDAPVSGNIDFRDDQDWYRFEVKSGATYVFGLEGGAGGIGTLNNPYLRVLDSGGNEIASNDDFGTRDSQIGYSAAADGLVYVSAQTADGSTGTYRLSAHEIAGDVPESAATKAELTVSTPASGNIDFAQDADWHRFEVKSGATYLFDLEGSANGAGSLGNPFLRVLDANGNEIASNGDAWWTGTPNSQIGYSAAADGLVYVSAQTEDGGTGTYRLSAHEIAGDVPGSTATTAELSVNAPVLGSIDFAFDQDLYQFQVKSGTTYVFDLEGSATGAGTWGNPYLRLLDSAGNEITSNDDAWWTGSPNSQIAYSAGFDGAVLVASGWPSWGWDAGTGTFRLSASEIVGDVPGSTATTTGLTVDAAVLGNIDLAFDQDWYRFEVKTGSTYVFDLEGSYNGAGTWGNPYLRLLDSGGNEIASNDDAGNPNSQIAYSAPADGVVYVSAGMPSGWDPGTGTYRLSAHEVVGDVSDNTGTTATLAIGGSLKGMTDFVGDHDWYRVEVQAGHTYAFDLKANGDGNGSVVNPFLALRDADGNELRSDDNGGAGSNAQLGYSATADSVLYVDATGADAGTGSYKLSAREVQHDQPDNQTTTATLKVGQTIHAVIDFANDSDWFKAEMKAGHTYVVDVEGIATLAGSLGDPRVVVSVPVYEDRLQMDWGGWNDLPASFSLGAFVVESEAAPDDPDNWSQWTVDHGGNGHYYRVVTSSNGIDWQTANELATAGGAHLGSIASAEENTFVQQLLVSSNISDAWLGGLQRNPTPEEEPAGGWAWATGESFDFVNWRDGEPNNYEWNLTPSIENDDGGVGANAQAGFTAIDNGVRSVRVSADDAQTGTYTVKLREVVGDIAGDANTSNDLAIGKQVRGSVDFANDQDWFRVQVEAGQTYVFEAQGTATRNGKLADPSLRLLAPDGTELANGSDAGVGLNDRIVYTADADRTLYLAVAGANEDEHGSYKVVASQDNGAPLFDLPRLHEYQALPEAAIQASSDNAPNASGETYLTWIGGKAAYDDAIGTVRVEDGNVLDPQLVFNSSKALCVGESASLGTVNANDRLGLFMIPNAEKTVPHLKEIGPDDLALRNPESGDLARSSDSVAPELVRLDGSVPALVRADLFFALDEDPGSRTVNPLNAEGFAQATVGSFFRGSEEVCRIVAFEDSPSGGGTTTGDFNDAILALSINPLSQTDIAAIHDYLLA